MGNNSSRRIEYRAPDPACNPYLAFSVMLAAGLEGIENNYELLEFENKIPASLNALKYGSAFCVSGQDFGSQ